MNMFTTDRSLHSRAVALWMQSHAAILGLDAQEAFLCGWLHDIAYAFGDNRTHAQIGGQLLRQQGYPYWQEIALHGTPAGLRTTMGLLLNTADMQVNAHGDVVGFDSRLRDVQNRYGEDSSQYYECNDMIERIKSTPFWRRLQAQDNSPNALNL